MSDPVQEALDCAADDGMDRRHYATIRAAIDRLRAEVVHLWEVEDAATKRAEKAEAEAAQLRAEKEAAESRYRALAERVEASPVVEVREVGGSLIASSYPAMHELQVGQRVRLLVVEGGE